MPKLTKRQEEILEAVTRLGDKQKAANELGISRSTVRSVLKSIENKDEPKDGGWRVLVIGDCHMPAMLESYIPFLQKTYRKYKCNRVVHIGDSIDWASISYHPKAPSLKNSEEEYAKAVAQMRKMHKAFPKLDYLMGNHDALTERQASDVGLPLCVLKDFNQLWDVPEWNVIPRFGNIVIDGVLYQHGDKGRGGQFNSAFLNAQDEHRSVVQGHFHAQAGVMYFANQSTRIFGLQVGSGCDHRALALSYGVKYNKKPIIGCGVVIEGHTGIFEPMLLGDH